MRLPAAPLKLSAVAGCLLVVFLAMKFNTQARPAEQLLHGPGQDAHLKAEAADAFVHFERKGEILEVHILIRERGAEGELMRTRVGLADGQSHVIRLASEDIPQGRGAHTGFTVQRLDDKVLAGVIEPPAPTLAGLFPSFGAN